jgi:hypothetical protein
MGGKSCKFQRLALAAIPDNLIGGFSGGSIAADSCPGIAVLGGDRSGANALQFSRSRFSRAGWNPC